MTDLAFDDQCTGANPVCPLIKDIKQIYTNTFNGVIKKILKRSKSYSAFYLTKKKAAVAAYTHMCFFVLNRTFIEIMFCILNFAPLYLLGFHNHKE